MEYENLPFDVEAKVEALRILINQCWKTLPIYEGKDKYNKENYSKQVAYENYQKHLNFLITKVYGASKIWNNNQYYIELLCILIGMKEFKETEHANVKYAVNHCTKLLNNMIEEVINHVS